MTWRQAQNVSHGYRKKVGYEYERDISVMRHLYSVIANLFSKTPKSAQEYFPLEMDRQNTIKKTKNILSLKEFAKILSLKVKRNEEEVRS
jgi:hypothetical protein